MTDRLNFPVYRVDHDDFTGRLRTRLSFAQHPEPVTHHRHEGTDLVDRDTMDGGFAGTITAPAGSRLGTLADGVTTVLILADGTTIGAEDARRAARVEDRRQSCGLGWIPAKEA